MGSDIIKRKVIMINVARFYNTPNYFSYSPINLSEEIMAPLIREICNFDPSFRKLYQTLLDQLPAVLSKEALALQQFTEILKEMSDAIANIKSKAIVTRSELANIRDNLALSIREAKTQLDELNAQKQALLGQKEVIEKQINAKKAEIEGYMIAFWIFNWIIALILESIKPFDDALNEIKAKLAANQREIESLENTERTTQQLLDQSIDLFNSNQQLCTQCDNLQGNIDNIQNSLKRLDTESRFLHAKLVALEKDWSGLMDIANRE